MCRSSNRGRRPAPHGRRAAPLRGDGTTCGSESVIVQSGIRPITIGSSPIVMRVPSGRTNAPVPRSRWRRSGPRREDHPCLRCSSVAIRTIDRTLEHVALFASMFACGVGQLGGERVVETGEPFGVVGGERDRELVRHDGAAHAERAAGVHLAAMRRPISTGCSPLRKALPNAPSTIRSSRRSKRWSPIEAMLMVVPGRTRARRW